MNEWFTKFFYTVAACTLVWLLPVSTSASEFRQLAADIKALQAEHNISATGVVIIKDGDVIFRQGFGHLSHNTREPFTESSLFRIGSITKSVTALAALKQVEADKLALDTDINHQLPEPWLQHSWQESHPITLAMLLEHTAGFKELSHEEFHLQNDKLLSLPIMLEQYHARHKAHWQPGLHHSYTNLGPAYVGWLIETSSGSTYERFVQNNILKPLTMNDSGFFIEDENENSLVTGYDRDGTTPIPYWHMTYRPFGGMNSTLVDMTNYLQVFLNQGSFNGQQILTPHSIKRMQTPTSSLAARAGLTYGYGLGIYQWLNRGVKFYGHGGDADGYLARFGYSPDKGIAYFHVINAFNHRAHWQLNEMVEDILVADHPATQFPKRHTLSSARVSKIVGEYQRVATRFPNQSPSHLRIIERDNTLFTLIKGKESELIPVTDKHFRRRNQTEATIAITEKPNGEAVFQGDSGNYVQQHLED